MTEWRARYAKKITTAEHAIRTVPRGRRILVGSGAAEPLKLVHSLVEHGTHLADNQIVHLLTLGPAPYVAPGLQDRFRHQAFFIGDNVRAAVQEGRADFIPIFLSEIPALLRSGRMRVDVALIQVSPPDEHGFVSLGASVDVVRAATDVATLVIAEVNPRMPRTLGDSMLRVDDIDWLVPVEYDLPELPPAELDDVDRAIGRHVATLIPDGATLQMGIGRVPDAVLGALDRHHDLGVHTEMFSDGVMRLAELGVINGKRKSFLPGKIVTSFVMGSRALYRWVHDNPQIEMRDSSFTNDPFRISRNDRMVAINAALAVDLTGQVAADSIGGKFFSGIGGQVDFLRGSARSLGGRPIIAMRSTAKDGAVSRIQPTLEPGAGVVTSRGDVHYVVTEYGIADLWGKTVRERTLALIEIAHPSFRGELLAAAKNRKYVLPDQVVPRETAPAEEEHAEKLRSGDEVVIRPVRVTDEGQIQELFYGLSDESTYRRFLGYKRHFPHEEMQRIVDVDGLRRVTLVAVAPSGQFVGMVGYEVDPKTSLADVGFVVRDDWQNKGVGTVLMKRIIERARKNGLKGLQADVMDGNTAMLSIFERSGLAVDGTLRWGVHHLIARF